MSPSIFNLADALELFHDEMSNLGLLWNFYAVAIIGILALVWGGDRKSRGNDFIVVMLLGFLLFAAANGTVIAMGQDNLYVGKQSIEAYLAANPGIDFADQIHSIDAIPKNLIIAFHASIDVLVAIGIWLSNKTLPGRKNTTEV